MKHRIGMIPLCIFALSPLTAHAFFCTKYLMNNISYQFPYVPRASSTVFLVEDANVTMTCTPSPTQIDCTGTEIKSIQTITHHVYGDPTNGFINWQATSDIYGASSLYYLDCRGGG